MQPANKVPVSAFTVEYDALAPQLLTPIGITAPFDLNAPPNPAPVIENIIALWDTGADGCVIKASLAKKLGLVALAPATNHGIGGEKPCFRYMANLFLPNRVALPGVFVTDSDDLEKANFDILIGMDIITRGDLALSQQAGKTLFTFRMPSIQRIDFIPQQKHHPQLSLAKLHPNDPCHCGSGRKFKKCHGARG